jgi:hypothetical protein
VILSAGVVGVGASTWSLWPLIRNAQGYCSGVQRSLTDEELINHAVQYVLETYPTGVDLVEIRNGTRVISGSGRPAQPIPYKNAAEFFSINKGCCAVKNHGREGWMGSWISRVNGSLTAFVWVRYLVRYRDPGGNLIETVSEKPRYA